MTPCSDTLVMVNPIPSREVPRYLSSARLEWSAPPRASLSPSSRSFFCTWTPPRTTSLRMPSASTSWSNCPSSRISTTWLTIPSPV